MTGFPAVLLRCPAGHYEATTLEDIDPEPEGSTTMYCQRCPDRSRRNSHLRRFAVVKTATIYPGGKTLIEATP